MSVLCDWDYVCDIVDNFVSDERAAAPSQFWKQVHAHSEAQQIYVQCLVFKYISFTLGFGHKPLREAIRMIRNVSNFPGSNARQTVEISTQSGPAGRSNTARHASLVLGVSPPKRSRSNTVPNRRPSVDSKPPTGSRLSTSDYVSHDKIRRKPSDGVIDAMQRSVIAELDEDREVIKKLRDIMYTLSYMLDTSDVRTWDFSNLREVFLLWNKARGWEQSSKNFESNVMKRLSKPPDEVSGKEKWQRLFSELLSLYLNSGKNSSNKTLEDKKVGDSTKYWALYQEINQNHRNIEAIMTSLSEAAEKVYAFAEEDKVLPLLHIICDTIITVPFVPLACLEKVYASLQMFYLWAKPISSAVKEVLDLIQTEMKSPGYFSRMIYCQEQDIHDVSLDLDVYTPSSAVNIIIDPDLRQNERLSGIFGRISNKYQEYSRKHSINHHRVLIEHMFHSVFGHESCDLKALRAALKTCSASNLTTVCTEAYNVMEQSITMETHSSAQEFLRQQLEAISNNLVEDAETKASEAIDGQTEPHDESRPTSIVVDPTLKTSQSTGSLANIPNGVVNPPRNQSYLSRTTSCTSLRSAVVRSESVVPTYEHYAARDMRHAPTALRTYEKNQLSDFLQQMVRTTAKDFLVEKRKSGSFTSARKSYLLRHKHRASDPRDSGLIEDYSEPTEGHVSKSQRTSEILANQDASLSDAKGNTSVDAGSESETFWKEFLERGFESDINHLINDMDKLDVHLTPAKTPLEFLGSNSEPPPPQPKSPNKDEDKEIKEALESLNISVEDLDGPGEETPPQVPRTSSPKRKKRDKKSKNRFKTMRIKGKKIMRGAVKRSASIRTLPGSEDGEENDSNGLDTSASKSPDQDTRSEISITSSSSSSTPPSAATAFFDAVSFPRWRTVSDPLRDRKKSRRSSKYIHLSNLFQSPGPERSLSQSHLSAANQSAPTKPEPDSDGGVSVAIPKHFVYNSLSNSNDALSESSPNHTKRKLRKLNGESKLANDDEEARIRMDSGVVLDKPSDRPRYRRIPSFPQGTEWGGNGVAGVKISRKLAVRKNRKSRSSLSYMPERPLRKKVLKVMFVGNDRTVSNLARAYYELRRRQMTRAPLLNHVDLRMFYVPVGENSFEDERVDYPAEPSTFDLQIGEMLGAVDPWYRSSVTMTFSNVLRICPKHYDDDEEVSADGKHPEDYSTTPIVTPENIIASSLLEYSRFAVTTYHVPLFKANMRSSTDEMITAVFCTGVEIGCIAYKEAIKQGRFGKLVDLSSDNGPPEAFSSFDYAKFGINGTFKSSTKIDPKFYRSVSIVPVALINDPTKEQMLYAGADCMHVTMVENEKYVKSMKRLKRGQSEEEGVESAGNKLYISAAKMEVVRPTQGTFTVWIDQTLMYTNIKSIDVSRCVAPEYERHAPKRKHARGPPRYLSLPLKTYWPLSNPAS